KTVYIKFKLTDVIAKGGIVDPLPKSPQKPVPPEGVTLEAVNRLIMDREKFRYEDNNHFPALAGGARIQNRQVVAFDGVTQKQFQQNERPGSQQGWIRLGVVDTLMYAEVLPLLMTFRADSELGSQKFPDLKLTGGQKEIESTVCREYKLPR